MNSSDISRRGFIATATAAAATLSLTGIAGASESANVPAALTDGTYITDGMSMHGPITVETVIAEGAIASIRVLNNHESRVVGEYALTAMPARIIESQCVDADVIAGATITSTAIKSAVSAAIEKAGGNPDDFSGYVAPEPVAQTVEKTADVAIMGAGPAGLMAAWAAAEAGKSVIMFDRMGYVGGCTPITGCGIYTMETQLQKAWGVELASGTFESWYPIYENKLLDKESPYYNPDFPFIKGIMHSSSRAVDKMMAIGVGFAPMCEVGQVTFAPGQFQIGGRYAVEVIEHYITYNFGVEIVKLAPVTHLTMDGDRCVGLVAEGQDGTTYNVHADAVVIASGGWIMNRDLMEEYNPAELKFPIMGPYWADGSGMILARDEADAAWICMDKGVTSHYHAGVSLAETSFIHHCVPGVVVNGKGARFVDETISYTISLRRFKEEEGTDFYWVFDESAWYGLQEEGNSYRINYDFLNHTGDIISGDNYHDLAQKAGLPELEANLELVNACAAGEAEDPNGNTKLTHMNIDGPMFALKVLPTPYIAQGGVKIDTEGRVQREDYSVIEGLYAAGDVCGSLENRDGSDYRIGLTQAFGYGLIAGETVVADLA